MRSIITGVMTLFLGVFYHALIFQQIIELEYLVLFTISFIIRVTSLFKCDLNYCRENHSPQNTIPGTEYILGDQTFWQKS